MSDREPGAYHVGVKTRPDGTKDYSQALIFYKNEGLEKSDSIIDRLRGPIVVDQEREAKYRSLEARMVEKTQSGELASWLAETLNNAQNPDDPVITLEDVQGLEFVPDSPEIQELRIRYGVDYRRGYFSLNLAQIGNLCHKFTGRHAAGFVIHSRGFSLDPDISQTGIIFAPEKLSRDIEHEISHSIDPYLHKREPKERLLEEFAAYYRDTYIPTIYTTTSRATNSDGTVSEPIVSSREVYQRLSNIGGVLKTNPQYLENYSAAFTFQEDYEGQVDRVVKILQGLEEYMEKPDINKAIFNAQSVYELQHLLDVVKHEKGN